MEMKSYHFKNDMPSQFLVDQCISNFWNKVLFNKVFQDNSRAEFWVWDTNSARRAFYVVTNYLKNFNTAVM